MTPEGRNPSGFLRLFYPIKEQTDMDSRGLEAQEFTRRLKYLFTVLSIAILMIGVLIWRSIETPDAMAVQSGTYLNCEVQ